MVYTLFFSRMRETTAAGMAAYADHAAGVRARAAARHPGFVSQKTYVAEDGERLTVVVFTDAVAQRAWKLDPVHREAQERGRSDYYAWYRIVISDEVRSWEWTRRNSEVEA